MVRVLDEGATSAKPNGWRLPGYEAFGFSVTWSGSALFKV